MRQTKINTLFKTPNQNKTPHSEEKQKQKQAIGLKHTLLTINILHEVHFRPQIALASRDGRRYRDTANR